MREKGPDGCIRVLHVCEHFGSHEASFHGVARSFELWIPRLDHPPFHVMLCSRARPTVAQLERFQRAGVAPMWLGYGKMDPRNLFKLIRMCRREKVDVLHTHGYGACTWGRLAGAVLGIPVIVHERCNYGTVPWFQRPVEALLGPRTRLAFAVSESTRQFTIRKRYIPEKRVKLLYSGIPLDRVPPARPEERAALRAAHGAPEGVFLMGVAGRLEPHKGHSDLFEALANVRGELGTFRLWIIGDGYHQEALARRAAELGLAGVVEFIGYQADIWPWIRALDLQVFPSHREGTPNTLYEAMAAGNCILASTADGQGEILRNGVDALTVAPGDVEGLGAALLRLRGDSELRCRLAAAAAVRIRDFDMEKTLETMREAYVAAAEEGRRERCRRGEGGAE